nr:unnamed protein product [Mus musculus]
MSCTRDKILTDAKTLLERVLKHDAADESLVDQSAALHRRVDDMQDAGAVLPWQNQEDAYHERDMYKYKPHILLSKENTDIIDLRQENRQLWVSLEEHQDALELIMSKYRKPMLQLMVDKKAEDANPVLKAHQSYSAEIESQLDRICEMGSVMRIAVQVDNDQLCKVQEILSQMELENKELREVLSISSESLQVVKKRCVGPASQTIKELDLRRFATGWPVR